ncbi:ATPase [Plantactinospora endophytica]|uniref:ATPase n=1 Tax=Plantactinospora endophytica TaxID=673535 RepID=A0ABQ4DYV9_9ACTN|nr:ATPase [Plantactinospora endophytica]
MFNAPVTIFGSALAAQPAPVRVVRTLRADVATFTGRADQVRTITEAIGDAGGGVVAIHAIDGMPGVGKTALAVHVAHQLVDRYPDGQLFVDLHAHTIDHTPADPADVLAGLLMATGLSPDHIPDGLQDRAARWRDQAFGRRMLLVLDNAATGDQVAPLLPGSGSCMVLVTSRRRLTSLRRSYGATLLPLGVLPEPDAVELFSRVCPRRLHVNEHPAVVDVVRLCGRLPLAIAILAAGIDPDHADPVGELADELTAAQDRLVNIDERLDDRDIGVASAFTLSYQRLTADQQRVLRLISLTPGADVDTFAAAALTDLPLAVVRRHLRNLHSHRLLEHSTGQHRYRLHDLIIAYARAQATPAEQDEAVSRLVDHYQHVAYVAAARIRLRSSPARRTVVPATSSPVPDLPDPARATTWLRTERANLLACIAHARQQQDHTRTVSLAVSLAPLLGLDGPWPEAIEQLNHILATCRDLGDLHTEAWAVAELGVLRRMIGEFPQATDVQEQALAKFRELDNQVGEAWSLAELGVLRRFLEELPQATDLQEQALAKFRNLGNQHGEAWSLAELGVLRRMIGEFPQATDLQEQALAKFRELDNQVGEAWSLAELGVLRREVGDYAQAAALMEQALTLSRNLGNGMDEAYILTMRGVLYKLAGDYTQAATLLEQSMTISRELGDRNREAWTCGELGLVRMTTGDYTQAAALMEQALTTFRDLGSGLGQAWLYADLGVLRRMTGDYAAAATLLEQSLATFRGLPNNYGQAFALANLGVLRRIAGDYIRAATLLDEALTAFQDSGDRKREVEILNYKGDLLRASGEPGQAYTWHDQALRLARDLGQPLDEARALAGIGRCTLATGVAAGLGDLQHALAIFQRLGAAEAPELEAELEAELETITDASRR